MLPSPHQQPDLIWNRLQEPARSTPISASYLLLLAALDYGWKIQEPVFLLTEAREPGRRMYHFNLQRPDETHRPALRLHADAQIEAFIRQEQLKVKTESNSETQAPSA